MKKLLVKMFDGMYRHTKKKKLRQFYIKVITTFEGGQLFSETSRKLLKEYAGVDIGIGTYGACFNTDNVTPGVKIGKYCSVAPGVSMYTRDHPYKYVSTCPIFYNSVLGFVKEDVIPYGTLEIGNDVWIGRNAAILPSCNKIGDGAVIGAGAVVTHDVPPYAIVSGVPARIMKCRFDEKTISKLEKIKWWDWELSEIIAMKDKFGSIEEFISAAEKNSSDENKGK